MKKVRRDPANDKWSLYDPSFISANRPLLEAIERTLQPYDSAEKLWVLKDAIRRSRLLPDINDMFLNGTGYPNLMTLMYLRLPRREQWRQGCAWPPFGAGMAFGEIVQVWEKKWTVMLCRATGDWHAMDVQCPGERHDAMEAAFRSATETHRWRPID